MLRRSSTPRVEGRSFNKDMGRERRERRCTTVSKKGGKRKGTLTQKSTKVSFNTRKEKGKQSGERGEG